MSFEEILTRVERGDMSATQALEKLNDKLTYCYNGMANRFEDCKHVDAYSNKLMNIARSGMFDAFKIWFEDDLKQIGLDTTLSYEIKEETA